MKFGNMGKALSNKNKLERETGEAEEKVEQLWKELAITTMRISQLDYLIKDDDESLRSTNRNPSSSIL
jgi:hypothetical protein